GTSASAPEIAAAASVVLQAGRLGGHQLKPADVRKVLEQTGQTVATPPQIDQPLHVGPQIDVTPAVEKVPGRAAPAQPSPLRRSGPRPPSAWPPRACPWSPSPTAT